jgi:hypothetical protein
MQKRTVLGYRRENGRVGDPPGEMTLDESGDALL